MGHQGQDGFGFAAYDLQFANARRMMLHAAAILQENRPKC
jgi:hypothetical protein